MVLAGCALVALAGCHHAAPRDKAAQDARAIALVHDAQHEHPPVQPLHPGPVSFAALAHPEPGVTVPPDVARPAAGEGCTFRVGARPVFVAVPQFGLARPSGKVELFAADSGSPLLANGLHGKYESGFRTVDLVQVGDGAKLEIRDRFGRVTYAAAGSLSCQAKAS